jgi:hypothetical protein
LCLVEVAMNKPIALLAILLLSLPPVLAAATAVEEKVLDAKGVREVAVDNVNGRIELVGTPRADILIRATKNADSAARLQSLEFTAVKEADGRLVVETKPTRAYLWGVIPLKVGGRIDYRIEVPQGMAASLTTVNGDILAVGPIGVLRAETVNGDIKAEVASERASAETVNGGIHLNLSDPAPQVQAETINGSITLRLVDGADVRYGFETVSGSIRFVPERIKVKGSGPKEIEGTFGAGKGEVRAETVSGSIVIHLGGAEAI